MESAEIYRTDPYSLIWHVLSGHLIGALEPRARLQTKVGKLATELGLAQIKALGYESKDAFIEQNSTS